MSDLDSSPASARHPGLDPGSRCPSPPPEVGPRIKSGVTVSGGDIDIPAAGSRFVPPADDWTPTTGSPGWCERMLVHAPGMTTQLMRVAPGTITAAHAHDTVEQVYIITGSLTDEDGTHHPAGSFIVRAAGAMHGGTSHDGATLFVVYGGPSGVGA